MAQLSRRRWLEEGLSLLEEVGAEALPIESLTSRLGVTKGPFSHHSNHYQDFQERLLSFWQEEGTLRILQWAEQEAKPPEKLARVIRASLHSSRLDVALRGWAFHDDQVRVHHLRIDQQRLAYLEVVVFAIRADPPYAKLLARLLSSRYVGSQHIIPSIEGEELGALYQLV
ncbi:TetR/AcrR family transcriptional regulator [Ktedonosporobacter rubrisoli]|uniref:TetR/AcrR family transcriptional regulator n=2 Tax=Ktedonosporobacter rubrisoli TaxID=2509675 RepID=A0A4P6K5H2_KTERU|nr:TetR/AcrR family transcriptional regulator [Ktedonosporobacter rubrisoli]